MKKITIVVGTRPEAIKMAPVILEIREKLPRVHLEICSTGQQADLLGDVFRLFSIMPDCDLQVMKPGQSLASLTASVVAEFSEYLISSRPNLVVVHGDTTTSFSAALAAFYLQIPVAHVEAGLRTGDMQQPFPEEMNRSAIALVADLHFAPTLVARDNLLAEGISADKISVTGNTVVDAAQRVDLQLREDSPGSVLLRLDSGEGKALIPSEETFALVTIHRRENLGGPLENILRGLKILATSHPNVKIILTLHPNPGVLGPIRRKLSGIKNIWLVEPLEYPDFVRLLKSARVVLTDSGGVQEEAVSFGTPVCVLREKSERPEGIDLGAAFLVGSDDRLLVQVAGRLLASVEETTFAESPYGDGKASIRIVEVIGDYLDSSV